MKLSRRWGTRGLWLGETADSSAALQNGNAKRWNGFIPTHDDEAVMDGAPERWWLVKEQQLPPLRYGMEMYGDVLGLKLEARMKKAVAVESASARIEARIEELGDWRGKTLAKVRGIILKADPEIVEEWKWAKAASPGVPVWSRGGIICTGETYKSVVKLTFAKGASLEDPAGLFNASLEGNVRRAIDIREGEKVNEAALKKLIRAAVALNLRKSGKRAVVVSVRTRREVRQ